jgi:hypothetical protein
MLAWTTGTHQREPQATLTQGGDAHGQAGRSFEAVRQHRHKATLGGPQRCRVRYCAQGKRNADVSLPCVTHGCLRDFAVVLQAVQLQTVLNANQTKRSKRLH